MKLLFTFTGSKTLSALSILLLCSFALIALPIKATAGFATAATPAEDCTISNNYVSQNQTLCLGQTVAGLTGSIPTGGNGSFSYKWESSTTGQTSGFVAASGLNNSQHYQPFNLSQTTWFRRVTYSGSCVNVSEAVQITLMPPLEAKIEISGSTALCTSDAVILTAAVPFASPGITYQWLRDNAPIPRAVEASFMATEAGSYQVRVSASGCSTVSEAVSVTLSPRPPVSILVDGPTRFCPGTTRILSANVSSTASDLTYQWLRDKKPIPGATQPTLVAPGAGLYHLEVSAAGCKSGAEPVLLTFIDFPAAPGPIAGKTSVCAGEEVAYSIPGSKSDLRYKWTIPDGYAIKKGQGTETILITAGNMGGTLTVSAYNVCDSVSTATLEVAIDPACAPLRVAADTRAPSLQLYPNPATAAVFLQLQLQEATTVTVQVYDVAGKLLYEKSCGRTAGFFSEKINVKDYPNGLYRVQLMTENSIFTKRFVKN